MTTEPHARAHGDKVRAAFASLRRDDAIDTIRRGYCPLCDAGPFVVPAIHISFVHNIRRDELRIMLGLTNVKASLCDPTHSARMTDRNHEHNSIANAIDHQRADRHAMAGRTKTARYLLAAARRDREIAFRYATGLTHAEVATAMGLSDSTVLNALHRLGVSGRPSHQMASAASSAAAARQRQLRHEFIEGGGTIEELAALTGISRKSLAARLRADGVDVPTTSGRRYDLVCVECGSTFESSRHHARFCGGDCRRRARTVVHPGSREDRRSDA